MGGVAEKKESCQFAATPGMPFLPHSASCAPRVVSSTARTAKLWGSGSKGLGLTEEEKYSRS